MAWPAPRDGARDRALLVVWGNNKRILEKRSRKTAARAYTSNTDYRTLQSTDYRYRPATLRKRTDYTSTSVPTRLTVWCLLLRSDAMLPYIPSPGAPVSYLGF